MWSDLCSRLIFHHWSLSLSLVPPRWRSCGARLAVLSLLPGVSCVLLFAWQYFSDLRGVFEVSFLQKLLIFRDHPRCSNLASSALSWTPLHCDSQLLYSLLVHPHSELFPGRDCALVTIYIFSTLHSTWYIVGVQCMYVKWKSVLNGLEPLNHDHSAQGHPGIKRDSKAIGRGEAITTNTGTCLATSVGLGVELNSGSEMLGSSYVLAIF